MGLPRRNGQGLLPLPRRRPRVQRGGELELAPLTRQCALDLSYGERSEMEATEWSGGTELASSTKLFCSVCVADVGNRPPRFSNAQGSITMVSRIIRRRRQYFRGRCRERRRPCILACFLMAPPLHVVLLPVASLALKNVTTFRVFVPRATHATARLSTRATGSTAATR